MMVLNAAKTFAETFSNVFITEPSTSPPSLVCAPNNNEFIDNITDKLLQTLCKPLSIFMKQSFYSSQLPYEWKTVLVWPIYKKGDKFYAANYRPISLTSIVTKVMKSIVYNEASKFLLCFL